MADLFEPAANYLVSSGFMNLMLFIFFSAIIYALLRRSKLFGESALINGIVSLVPSFFIFIFPYISGISLIPNFTIFFTQLMVFSLIFIFGLIIASLFYPNLLEFISKTFKHRTQIWIGIAIVVVLLITSGLINVITLSLSNPSKTASGQTSSPIPPNVSVFLAAIFIFLIFILIGAAVVRGE